jgi:hypothetical protein
MLVGTKYVQLKNLLNYMNNFSFIVHARRDCLKLMQIHVM